MKQLRISFVLLLCLVICFLVCVLYKSHGYSPDWSYAYKYANEATAFKFVEGQSLTTHMTIAIEVRNDSEKTQHLVLNTTHFRQRVALLVPYRNRTAQLPKFIENLFPFLAKQGVNFRMFLVEQDSTGLFNRAKLFNVGYNESSKYGDFDCFIFHDVDLIPENPSIEYKCQDHPEHMSVAVDTFNYRLPYATLVGGVLAMNKSVFQHVNGFSNLYFGWGGEDDDMAERNKLLLGASKRFATDGLNSLNYTLVFSNSTKNYVHILVKL